MLGVMASQLLRHIQPKLLKLQLLEALYSGTKRAGAVLVDQQDQLRASIRQSNWQDLLQLPAWHEHAMARDASAAMTCSCHAVLAHRACEMGTRAGGRTRSSRRPRSLGCNLNSGAVQARLSCSALEHQHATVGECHSAAIRTAVCSVRALNEWLLLRA